MFFEDNKGNNFHTGGRERANILDLKKKGNLDYF